MRRKFWAVFASITLAIFNMILALAVPSFLDALKGGGRTTLGGPLDDAIVVVIFALMYGGLVAYLAVMPLAMLIVLQLKPRLIYALLLGLGGTYAAWHLMAATQGFFQGEPFPVTYGIMALMNGCVCWLFYRYLMRGHEPPNLTSPG